MKSYANETAAVLHRLMLNVMEEAGIYELPPDLESMLPSLSSVEWLNLVKQGLAQLYKRGWFTIWSVEWPNNNIRVLSDKEVESILSDDDSWAKPTEQSPIYFRLCPTNLGAFEWNNGSRND